MIIFSKSFCVGRAESLGGRGLGNGLLGGSALLLGDLLEHAGQAGNGGQHGAQDLGAQDRQRHRRG